MSTFARIRANIEKLIQSLAKYYELKPDLVENIYCYAQCLPKEGTKFIDELIFSAQMSQHFGLTNPFLVGSMYQGSKDPFSRYMSVQEYTKVVLTFVTENLDVKVDYVFNAYDANGDGFISHREVYTLFKPCVNLDAASDNTDESVKDLIDIVLAIVDENKDGNIDLDEFRKLVKNNILYLQLLGPCLPGPTETETFLSKMENKSPFQIKTTFANERYRSLSDMIPKTATQALYPIPLEM